jgi:hypothetical protein
MLIVWPIIALVHILNYLSFFFGLFNHCTTALFKDKNQIRIGEKMKTMRKLMVLVFVVFITLLTVQAVGADGHEYQSRGETNVGEEPPVVESAQTSTQNGISNGTLEQTWEQEQTMNGTSEGESQTKNQDGILNQWRYQFRHQILLGVENETVVMECNLSAKNGKIYIYNHE